LRSFEADQRKLRHVVADPQTRLDKPPIRRVGDDDYDMLADRAVVGRIMQAAASPVGALWMWTLIFGHKGRTPTHGYEATSQAAMAAFARSCGGGEF
jgi:hypothetical protein